TRVSDDGPTLEEFAIAEAGNAGILPAMSAKREQPFRQRYFAPSALAGKMPALPASAIASPQYEQGFASIRVGGCRRDVLSNYRRRAGHQPRCRAGYSRL